MGVWDFIQDQVLGMKWLNGLIGRGLSVLGLDVNGRIGGSVQFFIYDVLKITVLLCVLIFIISYIQSYFPPERSKRILGRFHGIWANIVSALLGTVTPFCSCSSIPLFIGFTSAGLPLGVTFSFLISSPIDVYKRQDISLAGLSAGVFIPTVLNVTVRLVLPGKQEFSKTRKAQRNTCVAVLRLMLICSCLLYTSFETKNNHDKTTDSMPIR